jgi:hypothetical protein
VSDNVIHVGAIAREFEVAARLSKLRSNAGSYLGTVIPSKHEVKDEVGVIGARDFLLDANPVSRAQGTKALLPC